MRDGDDVDAIRLEQVDQIVGETAEDLPASTFTSHPRRGLWMHKDEPDGFPDLRPESPCAASGASAL